MHLSLRSTLILFCALMLALAMAYSFAKPAPPSGAGIAAPPPITPLMRKTLEHSRGFEYLVEYGENGFSPKTLAIKTGQTVRFTNNSSHPLWVAATESGGLIYPPGPDMCGRSAFDSCVAIQPLEFWEFTFDAAGQWSYRNTASPSDTATITVVQ